MPQITAGANKTPLIPANLTWRTDVLLILNLMNGLILWVWAGHHSSENFTSPGTQLYSVYILGFVSSCFQKPNDWL